jgi:hypothetical protein
MDEKLNILESLREIAHSPKKMIDVSGIAVCKHIE